MIVRFASSRDGSALGSYLERLLHFDKTAAIRFVGVGSAAAAYSGPPFGGRAVLALRLVALKQDTASFDVTVLAGKLLEGLSRDESEIVVPDTMVGGPSWAGLLPPRTGWTRIGLIAVRELAQAAAQGNSDFRFRALGLDRAGLDSLGEEIWSRPVLVTETPATQSADSPEAPLALRTAHAAQALGFLGPDPEQSDEMAPMARMGRWLRVDAPYGVVLQRD